MHQTRQIRVLLRGVAVSTTGIVAALLLVHGGYAQTPDASAYPLILSPGRALAFIQAADRKLGYVPGEAIVKFKEGVTQSDQQRALAALRGRPTPMN
jgi:hypothetical protein